MGVERRRHRRLVARAARGLLLYFDFGLASSSRSFLDPSYEYDIIGFRVASVPEPSCLVLTILASGVLVTRRKR